jgi:hypothetical protein
LGGQIEPCDDDALSEPDHLEQEGDNVGGEKLDLIDRNEIERSVDPGAIRRCPRSAHALPGMGTYLGRTNASVGNWLEDPRAEAP